MTTNDGDLNHVLVYDEDARQVLIGDQVVLSNVHGPWACMGRPCVIHRPSDHHMREWPAGWSNELRAVMRRCPHGLMHADPDQVEFWSLFDPLLHEAWYSAHMLTSSCDGCCQAPDSGETSPLGADDIPFWPPVDSRLCPDGPHREPQGPNEDVSQCPKCWGLSWEMRPDGETFGHHLPDCSLPRRHESYCEPGGEGHPPAPKIRG